MQYRYRSTGYGDSFEAWIRLEFETITITFVDDVEPGSYPINTLARLGRVGGDDDVIVYKQQYQIMAADEVPSRELYANIFYYDLLAIRYVIEKRLQSLEVPIGQMKRLTNQYLIRYLDDIVMNVTTQTSPFVYYFVVSSAHLLAIPTPHATKRYFTNTPISYVSNPEDPNAIDMLASINRLYPQIIERLKCL